MHDAHEHMGEQIDIRGFSGVPMGGQRRNPGDTETALVLTLYGQDGEIETLTVPRTRDTEMFQEWLRRFDRYTVHGGSE